MPRSAPEGRFAELIDVAAEEFARRGVRLTRMSHVAQALGVATGTLYRYVDGKEALLDGCIQYAFSTETPELTGTSPGLPLARPAPGEMARHLGRRLRAIGGRPGALIAASASPAPEDPPGEIEALILELYGFLAQNRHALDFLERVARERPDLSDVYFRRGRSGLVDLWATWIERRSAEGVFRPVPDARVTARLVIEACAWLARHRHRDFDGASIDDGQARLNLVLFATRALCKEVPPDDPA